MGDHKNDRTIVPDRMFKPKIDLQMEPLIDSAGEILTDNVDIEDQHFETYESHFRL